MKKGRFLLEHPIAVGFALIVIFGALQALARISDLFLLGFFAVLFGILLSFPIDLLSRVLPRGVAVLATAAALVSAVGVAVLAAAPVLAKETEHLGEQLPEAARRFHDFWYRAARAAPIAQIPEAKKLAAAMPDRLSTAISWLAAHALPFAVNAVSVASVVVLVLALALFLAYQPESYREGLCALVPRDHEQVVDEAWRRMGRALRAWMGGILVSMTLMGTLTAIGLYIAGVKGWLLLALITFFGTFVPYAGAIASAIPALAVGLADSPRRFLYVCLVYLVVHLVEGYVVEPIIMRRAALLRPATLLLWQVAVSAIFGVPGVLVATPLLVCAKVAVGYFYIERVLHKTGPSR